MENINLDEAWNKLKKHVIFLDVNGVLNSVKSQIQLDQECFDVLKRLIDWFEADIVLSSTWRKHQDDFDEINAKLKEWIGVEIAGTTGSNPRGIKGQEILAFLAEHPEITDFFVIDDDSFDIEKFIRDRNFIHTNSAVGLTAEDIEKKMKIPRKD